jgi:hypothetical protein
MTHRKTADAANAPLGVSRRSFLNRTAMGFGLAPFASSIFGTALALDQSAPTTPKNLRFSSSTLSASDLAYLGAMRLPTTGYPSDEDPSYSYAPLAARKVNGVLHFFMTGSNPKGDRVFEFIDTQSLRPDYRDAPRAEMAITGRRLSGQAQVMGWLR